jgi:hypothetical protein
LCFEPWHRAAWVPADDKSPNLRVRHPVKLCARFESLRDSRRLKVRLECYSDSKADERPVRFYLGEQLRMVGEILDPGRGQTTFFSKFGQMMATGNGPRIVFANLVSPQSVDGYRRLRRPSGCWGTARGNCFLAAVLANARRRETRRPSTCWFRQIL